MFAIRTHIPELDFHLNFIFNIPHTIITNITISFHHGKIYRLCFLCSRNKEWLYQIEAASATPSALSALSPSSSARRVVVETNYEMCRQNSINYVLKEFYNVSIFATYKGASAYSAQ